MAELLTPQTNNHVPGLRRVQAYLVTCVTLLRVFRGCGEGLHQVIDDPDPGHLSFRYELEEDNSLDTYVTLVLESNTL